MGSRSADVKLQNPSSGIAYETYTNRSHLCTYGQDNIAYKDELYIFRCPADKECCGRECCVPGAAGIPLWLLILLLILLGILLVLLCAGIVWLCRRLCKRKPKPAPPPPPSKSPPLPPPPRPRVPTPPPPLLTDLDNSSIDGDYRPSRRKIRSFGFQRHHRISKTTSNNTGPPTPSTEPQSSEVSTQPPSSAGGSSFGGLGGQGPRQGDSTRRLLVISEKPFIPDHMEEAYLPPPQPIAVRAHNESEFTEEQRPLLTRSKTPDEQQAKMMYYRPFVPSPMEETVVPVPERSQVEYHHTSEFMKAQQPEYSAIDTPDSKQADVMFYRPGFDKVAAY